MQQVSVNPRYRSTEVSKFVSRKQCRTIRREEVNLRSACETLPSSMDARALRNDCGTKPFDKPRKSHEQSEAFRAAPPKSVSNKGFLMVLILTGCRYMYHFLNPPRTRDFISTLSKSPPERQYVKNALFPRHFLSFAKSANGH